MQKELLPPADYYTQLENRLKNLKTALSHLRKAQEKQPQGHLRIAQKGGTDQFYHYDNPKDFKGHFLPRAQDELAKQLAQKDYNSKVIKEIEKEIAALQNYLAKTSHGHTLAELYTKLCPARQKLITPATLTDEQFAEQWLKVTWKGRPFSEGSQEYYTAKHERVRSKSELIIADTLYRHGVHYRYEFPLTLHRNPQADSAARNDSITLCPDFLCLNLRTRRQLYWEHFGLMSDPDYAEQAVSKLRLYTMNNLLPGRDLILTMETQNEALSTQVVENLIETCLK